MANEQSGTIYRLFFGSLTNSGAFFFWGGQQTLIHSGAIMVCIFLDKADLRHQEWLRSNQGQ